MDASEKLGELKGYLDGGYSFIPMRGKHLVSPKDKRDWVKEFSLRQPTGKETENWARRFDYFALLSGNGLGLLDIDGKGKSKVARGLGPTACYSTQTPGHFRLAYTMSDPVPSQRITSTVELFGRGGKCWAIAPPSPENEWRISLADIQPFPMDKLGPYLSDVSTWPVWNYHGHDCSCIGQILRRQLEPSERNNALHILGVLLLRADNEWGYMERVVREKNASLRSPLGEREIEGILQSLKRNRYNAAGCGAVRRSLHWVNCKRCLIPERRVKLTKEGRLLIAMDELAGDSTAFAVFVRILADDMELPYNISEIARRAKLNRETTSEKVKKLQDRGFLPSEASSQKLSF